MPRAGGEKGFRIFTIFYDAVDVSLRMMRSSNQIKIIHEGSIFCFFGVRGFVVAGLNGLWRSEDVGCALPGQAAGLPVGKKGVLPVRAGISAWLFGALGNEATLLRG